MCNGDWVFQIDADEIPNEVLIENLHEILTRNTTVVEVVLVPRVNTVEGLTDEHIKKSPVNPEILDNSYKRDKISPKMDSDEKTKKLG